MGLLPMRSGLDGDPGFGPQAVALDRHYHEVQNLVEAIPSYYLTLRTRIQNLSELISLSTSSTTEVVRPQAILAPQFVAGLRPGRHAADRGLSLSTVAMPGGEAGRSQVGASRVVMMVSPRRGRESDHREGHGRGSYRRRRGDAPARGIAPLMTRCLRVGCPESAPNAILHLNSVAIPKTEPPPERWVRSCRRRFRVVARPGA